MNDPIRCESLSKKFRSAAALDRVDLVVPRNSIYALVGPNGAGKTTLIKILLNLRRRSAGSAIVLGKEAARLSPKELARIGYVSENQELPEWMTVSYLLAYAKRFYPTWDDTLAHDLIRQFDLPLERKLRHLSRGMKVKAALAAALAFRPELIVLDEPFTGLDPLVRDEVVQGLLARAENASVLVSSHDLAEIESFASHIGYLEAGTLRFSQELAVLSARFREIEITVSVAELPSPWPAYWLKPETSPALIRFVDSEFNPDTTAAELHRAFPDALHISVKPMPLRDIFVALARSTRKAA